MPSERVQRQIDQHLDEAEAAIRSEDWPLVSQHSPSVLSLHADDSAAASYLAAAEGQMVVSPPLHDLVESSGAFVFDSGREMTLKDPRRNAARLRGDVTVMSQLPPVQYARSADGLDIAYYTIGSGPPLMLLRPYGPILSTEWTVPTLRAFYQQLAEHFTLINLDYRGIGLSDHDESGELTLDKFLADITAVMDRCGVSASSIVAVQTGAAFGLALAARLPERVLRLVAVDTELRGRAMYNAFEALRQINPLLAAQAAAALSADPSNPEDTASHVAHLSELDHSQIQQFEEFLRTTDLGPEIEQIDTPVLFVHPDQGTTPLSAVRMLVAKMRHASLQVVRAGVFFTLVRDRAAIQSIIDFVLAENVTAHPADSPSASYASVSAFRTILFTDIEAHTRMMQRLGDARGREVLREHERLTREALAAHGGIEVKTMGDGFMASFGSAQRALECAVALQRSFESFRTSGGETLRIRVGINAGEPIAEDDDLFGSSVIVAARTAAQAQGGEVLVTNVVRELVAGKGFAFTDRGEVVLRGIDDAVRIHALHWKESV